MEEQSQKRVFVEGETAASLNTKLDGLTGAQGEALLAGIEGQWLEATGVVIDVSKNDERVFGPSLSLLIGNRSAIYCMFDIGDEGPLSLNKGDGLSVEGQIMRISARTVPLEHCKILQVVPRDQLEEAEAATGTAQPTACEPETGRSDKPRLPDAALKLWFQAFKVAYPDGSQMLAEKSAAAAFPNHHVARKRIRELLPNSPRGRPKKISGLDNPPQSDGE